MARAGGSGGGGGGVQQTPPVCTGAPAARAARSSREWSVIRRQGRRRGSGRVSGSCARRYGILDARGRGRRTDCEGHSCRRRAPNPAPARPLCLSAKPASTQRRAALTARALRGARAPRPASRLSLSSHPVRGARGPGGDGAELLQPGQPAPSSSSPSVPALACSKDCLLGERWKKPLPRAEAFPVNSFSFPGMELITEAKSMRGHIPLILQAQLITGKAKNEEQDEDFIKLLGLPLGKPGDSYPPVIPSSWRFLFAPQTMETVQLNTYLCLEIVSASFTMGCHFPPSLQPGIPQLPELRTSALEVVEPGILDREQKLQCNLAFFQGH
uniref:uncharacterized protein LOC101375139 n=1 Tax=Odobenus rosmarus divergens TaxID=9708 RepID=UPI00063C701B|nr:PREDICTED: uncharacterized protein LOC101375139 [Odobenus rosmarus divergens]